MSDTGRCETERGVSDVIGFVLVVSLILTTVGVVYVAGFGGLQDARSAEHVNNAERAFDVLGDNMHDISRESAPSRATEIKLSGAQLAYGETTTLTVELSNYSSSPKPSFTTTLDPIVYSTNNRDTRLTYEAGAVIREERDGAVLNTAPPFTFAEDGASRTAAFQFVQTRSTGPTSVGGDTTVLVRADHVVTQLLNASRDPTADTGGSAYEVELSVDTTEGRAVAWERHLNRAIPSALAVTDPPCSRSGDVVTCTIAAERVFVSIVRIDVAFS